jgi:glycerate 2-kinase
VIGDEAALRRALEGAFREGLADLDPAGLVARALPEKPPEGARVRIVAAGKAAAGMARGALERWGDRVEATLVVTVEGAKVDWEGLALRSTPEVTHAAHPLPDERSRRAALAALDLARGMGPDDLLLALVSGGCSSLVALPAEGLGLDDKRRVVRALLEGGAPIQDCNLVRRHLSRIKGGRLAVAAAPAAVWTFVIGDVIGGALADIGSGPTVPDPSTTAEARAVLARYAPALLGEGVDRHLVDTPSRSSFPARLEATLLAGPEDLGRVVAARLAALGFTVTTGSPEGGDVHAVVARRIAKAAELDRGAAFVMPCEPTVTLPERRGLGGRAGWVALRAMRELPPGVALLCGASDGADGSSGLAGAVVSPLAARGAYASWLDRALAEFDDARAHRALGTAIDTGPTGQNLADVHILARCV